MDLAPVFRAAAIPVAAFAGADEKGEREAGGEADRKPQSLVAERRAQRRAKPDSKSDGDSGVQVFRRAGHRS